MSAFQKVKKYVMEESRSKKLDHFYSLCDIQSSVLDVGVSNNEYSDSINLFLKRFRLYESQYTGLAVESMEKVREKYPGKKFIEYPGGTFPFVESEFDWVFSNAVIEHVGDKSDQLFF
ncbi:methyltransferase domain-containing protein [Desulfobulbus sp. US2]|nr:methyltransferase domain-containing protein [Desulfobulbus sp. US2]